MYMQIIIIIKAFRVEQTLMERNDRHKLFSDEAPPRGQGMICFLYYH